MSGVASGSELGRVHVGVGASYDVVIGRDLLKGAGRRIRDVLGESDCSALLVSDTNVAPLYADAVQDGLSRAGFSVRRAVVPAGEATKCLDSYGRLLGEAADAGLTRSGVVVALGGGVVGDLAGFVAATYMRGCHLVQLPTSLLAMVDSSVGGKTAIDLPQGKNLAGAFHQPDLVLADLDCLRTLPQEFMSDGMGEVVKYGVMADGELFDWLASPIAGQEWRVIERCIAIKRDIVEADERESGMRKLLNLGHTVGHAIELLGDYRIAHGHAVAAGTAIMARACAAMGWCSNDDVERIESVIEAHGLPTATRRLPGELVEAALHDKKRIGTCIDAVIVKGIGRTEVKRLTFDQFAELVALGCDLAGKRRCAEDALDANATNAGIEKNLGTCTDALIDPGFLHGTVDAIASKSAAHRLLICAALADGPTEILCPTTSQDIDRTCDCLVALGAHIRRTGSRMYVEPLPYDVHKGVPDGCDAVLDCGESGSTLRFMLPVASALGAGCTFDGGGRLPERPIEPLRSRLVENGCSIPEQGAWPLRVHGRLHGGDFDLPGNVSSQFATGLLLALPLVPEGGTVRIHGTVESRPYIDMTISAMRSFGIDVVERVECPMVAGRSDRCPNTRQDSVTSFSVAAGSRYASPGAVAVEGDWSNAAFWLVAGALSPDPVTVTGLDPQSEQGDRQIVEALRSFGACVEVDEREGTALACGVDVLTGAPCELRGTTIDAHDIPDLVPVLSVLAACAEGDTRFVNAARLRIKESDRLSTTADMLRRLGATVDELPDGLVVHPVLHNPGSAAYFKGCTVSSHGDHRIAMAASIAATRASSAVVVEDARAVAKSYPAFFDDFSSLGGSVRIGTAHQGS